MSGKVFRSLKNPQVARDPSSAAAMIMLNGEEDEFLVLHLAGAAADELAEKLTQAGYPRGVRR